MEPPTWAGDFIADVFTDRLHPTEELSFNDPIPTKCSFGRGKRQEDIPIPRVPKFLLFQLRENVSSLGRGIQRKDKCSSQIPKPGRRVPHQKTNIVKNPQENIDSENLVISMEPLFLDQKCPLSIPTRTFPIDYHPISNSEKFGLDMENESEFPSLPTADNNQDKDSTSSSTKETKSQKKIKTHKKKSKKKS